MLHQKQFAIPVQHDSNAETWAPRNAPPNPAQRVPDHK
jgi:hypothetical protein